MCHNIAHSYAVITVCLVPRREIGQDQNTKRLPWLGVRKSAARPNPIPVVRRSLLVKYPSLHVYESLGPLLVIGGKIDVC